MNLERRIMIFIYQSFSQALWEENLPLVTCLCQITRYKPEHTDSIVENHQQRTYCNIFQWMSPRCHFLQGYIVDYLLHPLILQRCLSVIYANYNNILVRLQAIRRNICSCISRATVTPARRVILVIVLSVQWHF